MRGCARQRTEKMRTWAGVLGAGVFAALGIVALGPGCGLGGWTGDSGKSSLDESPCSDENIAYEQHSVQGASAEELVAEYGGTHQGTSSTVSDGFWDVTGLEAQSSPVPFELSISYADGEVVENACSETLSVAVKGNVRLGDGLAEWHVPAELEMQSGIVTLSVVLPRTGTAGAVDLDLVVEFDAQPATAVLRPVNGPAEATAEFVLE